MAKPNTTLSPFSSTTILNPHFIPSYSRLRMVAPYWSLVVTVFESILEVFILCVIGYILAKRGILDKKTQRQLNRLNVSLFTPSLLFSKVAFFVTPQKLRELWVIPIFFIVVTSLSMGVAFLLGWVLRLKRSQRSFAVAASMFMNSNSLPIALMQSLVVTVPGLRWEADDDKNSMLARALTYLVLYSTLGMVVRWSYGVRLLSQADQEVVDNIPNVEEPRRLEDGLEERFPHNSDASDNDHGPEIIKVLRAPPLLGMARKNNTAKMFYSFPNTPTQSVLRLPDSESNSQTPYGSEDEDVEADDELPRAGPITEPTRSRLQSIYRRTKRKIVKSAKALNEFMTVPLWAALMSFVVACAAPLQEFLKNDVPPVRGALNNAGNCSIPLTLVVLGAYFYTPTPTPDKDRDTHRRRESTQSGSTISFTDSVRSMLKLTDTSKGKQRPRDNDPKPGETKTVIIAIVSRMIITPALLMPLIILCVKSDWHEVFDDPVFVVSNVLLVSSPPALTLAQITQAASGDAFERLISKTIFWSYCVLTPPLTILYVVIGLKLAQI
ncbi:membrane transport protein-domain-containing protein [Thelephora terrestris]|uniref:Membrane transport protein-domain-containing protein n=1 Tax=Thelephora terrestris TaxID=56493 RepID=A0A9P6L9N1_9AGAM|nr:membrane transport protein-domain-containing protein [Thelephora terrestris]